MRRPRLKAPGWIEAGYYHCVSRVVDRRMVLGDVEKEHLVGLMRAYERLYGLRLVTYCVMTNHFHVLVEVPRRPAAELLPDDAGLVALVRECLGDKQANELEWELGRWRRAGDDAQAEAVRERWFRRMWDISAYMKVLKQRFSQWFNGRHGRRGTLWEDRFRSVLVEGQCEVLRSMAAYIDLNPVRAGVCEDPKDYRWSGYGEAVGGSRAAQAAVAWLAGLDPRDRTRAPAGRAVDAAEGLRRWRCWLFGVPEGEAAQAEQLAQGGAVRPFRPRVSRAKALEVLAQGGRLARPDFLRCRVRFFTDGAVLGRRGFVERVFGETRERFGPARTRGARLVRGLELAKPPDRLYALRDLRRDVFG